jgi:hypothetical protein
VARMEAWVLLIVLVICSLFLVVRGDGPSNGVYGWNLPIFPREGIEDELHQFTYQKPHEGKFIPRNVWIAVRNSSEALASHMVKFIARNHKWNVHIHGNIEKDVFMNTYFANTSINWVYNKLNPAIGCSRPEVWRLCVLYMFGGLYIDDDANINSPLDEVVLPSDKFIVGKEDYSFDDRCYIDSYPLSNYSMNARFGVEKNRLDVAGGRFFLNWALLSAPRSPIIARILTHIVALVKGEYTGRSKIKMGNSDHRGKLLMCATTYPVTHVIREMLLEGKYTESELGLRIVDTNFKEYGGDMKAWFNDYRADHWVKVIQKHQAPYLLEYAPPPVEEMSGDVIRGVGQKSIYLIKDGRRHGFNDFGTFMAMNYTLDDVKLLAAKVVDQIPLGDPVPSMPPKR